MKMQLQPQQKRTITLSSIPDGVAGIKATLALMVKEAQRSKLNFEIRDTALRLVGALPQKAYLSEVKVIHRYVRDEIRYVKDIEGVETLATPIETIRMGQGDCDDKALLAAALLISIGHPVRFVAVGRQPGEFEHVLIETLIANKWIPVETTENVPVGWYPPSMTQRIVYNI